MKKYIVYLFGVLLLAFSAALNYKVGFGSGAVDCFNKNITDAINLSQGKHVISIGTVVTISCLFYVLLYFIFTRAKDFYLPIIVSFLLGIFIDFFISILSFEMNEIIIRLVFFIVALNTMALSIAILVSTGLSPTPFECLNLIVGRTIFKHLSYGKVKVIIESFFVIVSCIIGFVFLNGFGEVSYATIIITAFLGPLIDLYLKLFKIKKREHSVI